MDSSLSNRATQPVIPICIWPPLRRRRSENREAFIFGADLGSFFSPLLSLFAHSHLAPRFRAATTRNCTRCCMHRRKGREQIWLLMGLTCALFLTFDLTECRTSNSLAKKEGGMGEKVYFRDPTKPLANVSPPFLIARPFPFHWGSRICLMRLC